MKKTRLLYYTALLATGCTFTACEKDNESPTNKSSLLTGKDWKMTAGSVNPAYITSNGTTIRDVYATYPACRQDDLLRFDSPNVLKELSGPTLCTGDAASKTGTWSLSNDQTQLYLLRQGKSTTDDYSVNQLTSTTLRLKTTETNNGVDYTFTYTYTAQ